MATKSALHFGTFDASMEFIKDRYNSMYKKYGRGDGMGDASIVSGMKTIKSGWKSVRGYETVNDFSKEVASTLQNGSEKIFKSYELMKDTMRVYAKREKHPLVIGSLKVYNYEPLTDTYDESADIELDPKTAMRGKTSIEGHMRVIVDYLNEMIDRTSSDGTFGFTWDGSGSNPRAAMHDAIVEIKENLHKTLDKYTESFTQLFEEDQKTLEAAMNEKASSFKTIKW